MDYFELMSKRTSSRKYKEEAVTQEELERIQQAGMCAPVGSKRYEDVHLTVVQDQEILRKLAEAAVIRRSNTAEMAKIVSSVSNAKEILEQKNAYDPFYHAPAVIFVSHRKQDLQPHIEWCNAASIVLAMHLATVEMGLGSCFMWFALESMRLMPEFDHTDLLGLPEGFEPLLGLAVGHIESELEVRDLDENRIGVTIK